MCKYLTRLKAAFHQLMSKILLFTGYSKSEPFTEASKSLKQFESLTISLKASKYGFKYCNQKNRTHVHSKVDPIYLLIRLSILSSIGRVFMFIFFPNETISLYLANIHYHSEKPLTVIFMIVLFAIISCLLIREYFLVIERRNVFRYNFTIYHCLINNNLKQCHLKLFPTLIEPFYKTVTLISILAYHLTLVATFSGYVCVVLIYLNNSNFFTDNVYRICCLLWVPASSITFAGLASSVNSVAGYLALHITFDLYRAQSMKLWVKHLRNSHNKRVQSKILSLIISCLNEYDYQTKRARNLGFIGITMFSMTTNLFLFISIIVKSYSPAFRMLMILLGSASICVIVCLSYAAATFLSQLNNLYHQLHMTCRYNKFNLSVSLKALEILDRVLSPHNGIAIDGGLKISKTFVLSFCLEFASVFMLLICNLKAFF
uniref:Gustatory receptor n=1 Tax=Tetranychus urticae TaxID=32264 RepID=T1KPP0_TETUR